MQAKPIIFNGDMVRAILDGRKTQTRRVINLLHGDGWKFEAADGGRFVLGKITSPHPKKGKFGVFMRREIHPGSGKHEHDIVPCPYGQPGDLLYVRETFIGPLWPDDERWPDDGYTTQYCRYAADGGGCPEYENADGEIRSAWTPSIHMPRWASRITLEITDVRVERLQDISEMDARAEGVKPSRRAIGPDEAVSCWWDYLRNEPNYLSSRDSFASLWQSIYGDWDTNPWVWVIEFKPHLVNVDEFLKG